MPWAAGSYTKGNDGTGGWTGDAGNGIGIEAGRHDTQDNDFTTGINSTLTKDGSNVPSANLPMGGFRHTGVGLATARDSYATLGQAQDGGAIWGGTSGGTANAQTLTLSPPITAYAAGQRFGYFAVATNTGALTININGLGAKAVQWRNLALTGNEIEINSAVEIVYDGTAFQSVQLAGNATSRAQAPTLGQVQDSTVKWGGTSGGSANAHTITPTPPITAYAAGQTFRFISGFTNTGNVTLNVNGLGAKALLSSSTGTNLVPGQITGGLVPEVIYDGTQFQMVNPTGTWATFSPVWTQSGTVSYTNNYSKYVQIGKTVHFRCSLLATSAGGGSTQIYISLPVAASNASTFGAMGGANYYDVSPSTMYVLSPYLPSSGQVSFVSDASAGNNFGAVPALTVGIGDYISLAITYEAA